MVGIMYVSRVDCGTKIVYSKIKWSFPVSKVQFSILLLSALSFQSIRQYYFANEISDEVNKISRALRLLDGGLDRSNGVQFSGDKKYLGDGRVAEITEGSHADDVRFDVIDKSLVSLSKKMDDLHDFMDDHGEGDRPLGSKAVLDESKISELYSKASSMIDDLPAGGNSDEYWAMKDDVISVILKLPASKKSELYKKLHESR